MATLYKGDDDAIIIIIIIIVDLASVEFRVLILDYDIV